ncbi:MAG: metallophosphoesterase [Bacteroidales bacterium]
MQKYKALNIRYILLILGILAIILIAGGNQLPKYASRLPYIGALAVIDMLYWLSIRKTISIRFKTILGIAYWLPMFTLLMFFITGMFSDFSQWTAFPRIYFPAILLILLIGKGIFLTLLLLRDLIFSPILVLKKRLPSYAENPGKYARSPIFLKSISIVSALVVLLFLSGMLFWVSDFKLTTVYLPVQNLPKEFDGYKIIQLSDMHLGTFPNDASLKKISKIVNGQKPDLILFTGDIVNLTTNEALPFENVMKEFSSNDGNFSILGNHDYGDYNHWDSELEKQKNDQELFDFHKRINWRLLRNENVIIKKGIASIAVVGVENWSLNKRFGKKGDLRKATKGTDSTQFQILMSHDPSHWEGEVTSEFPQIGLTLSGHTHAFQLAIESGPVKWSPASMLYAEWAGLYEKADKNGKKQFLYVNRGCGTIGYPGRVFTRPEITLIILQKSQ